MQRRLVDVSVQCMRELAMVAWPNDANLADRAFAFDDLCVVLFALGFSCRVRGSQASSRGTEFVTS